MKRVFTYILYGAVAVAAWVGDAFCASAIGPGEIRWHNAEADSVRITKILVETSALRGKGNNELVEIIGRKFVGLPYSAHTLEHEPEMLTVNIDEFDCTTFVETVAAMVLTLREGRNSWQDFAFNLEGLRYRQGRADGYASRLHYISDWIIDNSHRGNLSEVTSRMPGIAYEVKTLDFMSEHRDAYPAMKDDLTFSQVKDAEVGYRSHRFPYLRSAQVIKSGAELLRAGDIVALTCKTKGLDVSHLGIVVFDNDVPHLMHASSKAGKVIVDPLPLGEYLRKSPNVTGVRVIRIPSL